MRHSKYFLQTFLFIWVSSLFLKCNVEIEKNLIVQEYSQSPFKAYILSKKQNLTYKKLVIEKNGVSVYDKQLDQAPCKIVSISNDTVQIEYYATIDNVNYENGAFNTVVKYKLSNIKGSIAVEEYTVDSLVLINKAY
jgi:hypothetical protein